MAGCRFNFTHARTQGATGAGEVLGDTTDDGHYLRAVAKHTKYGPYQNGWFERKKNMFQRKLEHGFVPLSPSQTKKEAKEEERKRQRRRRGEGGGGACVCERG